MNIMFENSISRTAKNLRLRISVFLPNFKVYSRGSEKIDL